jgi:hypothetical protein
MEFLQVTFKQNGYCDWEIHNAVTVAPLSDDPASATLTGFCPDTNEVYRPPVADNLQLPTASELRPSTEDTVGIEHPL